MGSPNRVAMEIVSARLHGISFGNLFFEFQIAKLGGGGSFLVFRAHAEDVGYRFTVVNSA